MFEALKKLLATEPDGEAEAAALRTAVATLLAEMTRMDSEVTREELVACRAALGDLLQVPDPQAAALIDAARVRVNRLTSYFEPISVINRMFSMDRRVRLVEHLWRIAYADGDLAPDEDYLVRKLSDLLYVRHVDLMLGRQRARPLGSG